MELELASEFGAQFDKKASEFFAQNKKLRDDLQSLSSTEIDFMVDQIGREESRKIDCTQCARCCQSFSVGLNSADIQRLAQHLKLEAYQVRLKYLKKDHEGDLVFKQRPCAFLKKNCCSVYEGRPQVCRSFPHLHQDRMAGRGWNRVENTLICPIVFNTYQRLREYFHSRQKMESTMLAES